MSVVVTSWWNPAPLLASIQRRYLASVTKAGAVAATLAGPLAGSVRAGPGFVSSSHPAALFREFGTDAHDIAPHNMALRFPDGSFVSKPVPHPGSGAKPFLRPAAAKWPSLFGGGGFGL